MGPAVRRTRSQSRITAAPVQDPNYSGPIVGIAGAVRSNFALKARLLGTEFLDAETGRQKWDRVWGSWSPTTGWWRQSGTNWRPTTQSSNRSPPPSRERKFAMQRRARKSRLIT